MNIKIFNNGKIEQGFVLIGKTGSIRFKTAFAENMGFVKDGRWLVGIDNDEIPTKHIYILRPDEENKHNGWKMQYVNKSWSLSGKTVVNELKLEVPIKCKVEVFKGNGYDGFRLVLPIKEATK